MDKAVLITNQVLPILFLIGLGFFLNRVSFLTEEVVGYLRKMVVNLALPAALFVSFLKVELGPSSLAIFAVTFSLCILLFLIGQALKKVFKIRREYFPYLFTGFEYGMLGISLFAAAYGINNLGYIAVVDLGHEIFIWFLFLPALLLKRDGQGAIKKTVKSFASSPVVIAILSGILFNFLGGGKFLYELPVTGAIMTTMDFLSALTVPMILIILGFGINFNKKGISEALPAVACRICLAVPLALLINVYFIRNLLGLGKMYEAALFTLMVLPPPFIIPLYVKRDIDDGEKQYINNVLTLNAAVSVIIYLVYFSLNPPA